MAWAPPGPRAASFWIRSSLAWARWELRAAALSAVCPGGGGPYRLSSAVRSAMIWPLGVGPPFGLPCASAHQAPASMIEQTIASLFVVFIIVLTSAFFVSAFHRFGMPLTLFVVVIVEFPVLVGFVHQRIAGHDGEGCAPGNAVADLQLDSRQEWSAARDDGRIH